MLSVHEVVVGVAHCFEMLDVPALLRGPSAISPRVGRQWPLCRIDYDVSDMFHWLFMFVVGDR